jgi:hypothetical protein
MADGRIIERGTHDALMRTGGEYCGMVRRQMASQTEDVALPFTGQAVSQGASD